MTGYSNIFNDLGMHATDVRSALDKEKQQTKQADLIVKNLQAGQSVNIVDFGAYRAAAAQAMAQQITSKPGQPDAQNTERSYSYNPRPPFRGKLPEVKPDMVNDLKPQQLSKPGAESSFRPTM